MMNTVPKTISPRLAAFCASIASASPIFVNSKPSSDAKPSFCFDNVKLKMERAGGSVQYGWSFGS